MLRRPRSQPRRQTTPHRTAFHELPEGRQQLIRDGLETLRDPEMNRRVHERLEARGDSPRDLIGEGRWPCRICSTSWAASSVGLATPRVCWNTTPPALRAARPPEGEHWSLADFGQRPFASGAQGELPLASTSVAVRYAQRYARCYPGAQRARLGRVSALRCFAALASRGDVEAEGRPPADAPFPPTDTPRGG